MAGGYIAEQILAAPKAIGASETGLQVGNVFKITAEGALHFRVELVVTASTVAAGITAKLQHAAYRAGEQTPDWVDTKTVAITAVAARTVFEIALLDERTTDQQYMPLKPHGRIVFVTGAGDSATVADIRIIQER